MPRILLITSQTFQILFLIPVIQKLALVTGNVVNSNIRKNMTDYVSLHVICRLSA